MHACMRVRVAICDSFVSVREMCVHECAVDLRVCGEVGSAEGEEVHETVRPVASGY